MATSGTVGQTVIDVTTIIEHAVRRCGVKATTITAEQQLSARENLFLILSDLSNRGVSLWCVQKTVIGLLANQTAFALPVGTVDVLNANYRTTTRLTGTATASAGTAANAFDGDLSTACTQVATGGYIALDTGSAQVVNTLGINANSVATLTLALQSSSDGVTWATVATLPATTTAVGQWNWFDIDPTASARYWRILETGSGILNLNEVYFGNTPYEITMYKMSRDDYTNLPNKNFAATRIFQFWFDKQAIQPRVWLWPNATSVFDQLVFWTQMQMQDIGAYSNTVNVPQRWLESIIFLLAHRVSLELPIKEVPPDRIKYLEDQAEKHLRQAEDGETDGAPIRWAPNLTPYTA